MHVVLTEGFVGLRGADDVGNEGGPVFGPFVLENLDEDHVEFGHVDALLLHQLRVRRRLDDQAHDVLLDALALRPRQRLPSRLDHVLQDLSETGGGGRLLGFIASP